MGFAIAPATATLLGEIFWGVAALSGVLVVVARQALLPLYLALTVVTLPIGFVVSHVLMACLYFLVVTPLGALMRIFGWDPMYRRIDKAASTYWAKRPPRRDPKHYFHQY
jgi:hypothetical protein